MPRTYWPEPAALGKMLGLWVQQSDRPLVLLMDEIDALIGDTLISRTHHILRKARLRKCK